jgi:hypothetical protein
MSEVFVRVVPLMNGARFAANLSRDLDEEIVAARTPAGAHTFLTRRATEQRITAKHAALDRMRARYEAKYHAAQRAAPPALPTSGEGWRLLSRPHGELEALARHVHELAFHGVSWPAGWHVRWGDLTGLNALGVCVMPHRLLLIDPKAQRGRTPREFLRTLAHELVHILRPDDVAVHGPRFWDTLANVTHYICGDPDEPAPPRKENFRPAAWPGPATTVDGWERRG